MTMDDGGAREASGSTLVIGRRPWLAGLMALVALSVSTLALLGAVIAVVLSGPTVIYAADDRDVFEWAPPLEVYQWLIAGVIEFALIATAAAAWWGAWALWAGRSYPGLTLPSLRPFAFSGGSAMIAAAALALALHVRNWREWRTLVVAHPEWGESAQSWQIPVGAALVVVIVGAVCAAMAWLWRHRSIG